MQRDDDGSFEEIDESVAEQAERRAKVLNFIITTHLYILKSLSPCKYAQMLFS